MQGSNSSVRSLAGTPIAADFYGATGTPIVIDISSGNERLFILNSAGVVTEVAMVMPIDSMSLSAITLDTRHHEIHEGDLYRYTDSTTLGSGISQDYLITTPNTTKWAHMMIEIDGSAVTSFFLYEATDKTGTTLQNVYNANRNSANTATTTVRKGTSGGTTDGVLLVSYAGGAA
ncbi:MAG: hypothetical protein NTW48_10135, partial [Chloroflexi bacterium]|nr:hypothetical protein [Chloroflexota bacterium]